MANQGIRPPIDQTRSAAAKPKERPSAMKDATQIRDRSFEGRIRRGHPNADAPRSDAGGPAEGAAKARSQSSGRWLTTRAGRRTRYAMTIHISSAKKAPPIRECVCQ